MKGKELIKLSCLVSFILWIVLNIIDFGQIYFDNSIISIKTCLIKILELPFIYFFVKNIINLIKNRKKNKTSIIITLIALLIELMLLFLTWPGMWSWDDVFIVTGARVYNLSPWQHFFSGLFQILCLKVIPIISGVIIIQIIISSLIIGYVVNTLRELIKFHSRKKEILFCTLLTISCLSFPVIEYLLSGFRMGIYTYLELLLVTISIKIYMQKDKISDISLFEYLLLAIIVTCWRSEAIYYVIALPIFLVIIRKNKIKASRIATFSILLIISTLTVTFVNNKLIGNNNYSISATINPIVEIVKEMKIKGDTEEFDNISSVINIDMINPKDGLGGEYYLWADGFIKNDYSKSDYNRYLKGYKKLLFKYPLVGIKAMYNTFYSSTGIHVIDNKSMLRTVATKSTVNTFNIFESDDLSGKAWKESPSLFKYPINYKLRDFAIRIIACIDKVDNVTLPYYLIWNLWIPIILIIITIILCMYKKDLVMSLIGLSLIGKGLLIFITASAPYFMYYVSIYVIGYVYSIFYLTYCYTNKKKHKPSRKRSFKMKP